MSKKKRVEKLTARNAQLEKSLSVLRSQLTKSENKLRKTEERMKRWKDEATAERTAADGLTAPDQTWTVAQLRAEARARGLAGFSNKPKAQLITALTRDA